MAIRIGNQYAYASPIAQAVRGLGQAFMSGPSPQQQELYDAQTENYRLNNRETEAKLQGIDTVQNVLREAIAPMMKPEAAPSPDFVGPQPLSKESQAYQQVPELGRALAEMGKVDQLPKMIHSLLSLSPNLSDEAMGRSYVGNIGKPISVNGVDTFSTGDRDAMVDKRAALDKDTRVAVQTARPLNRGEQQGVLLRKFWDKLDALDPAQQAALGAQPKSGGGRSSPKNYITPDNRKGVTLDGVTDASTGEPIPQGAQVFSGAVNAGSSGDLQKSSLGNLERNIIEMDASIGAVDDSLAFFQAHPDVLGSSAWVEGTIQDLKQQSADFGRMINKLDSAIAEDMVNNGISFENPETAAALRNPNIAPAEGHKLRMGYISARINDPGARTVTDRDLSANRSALGLEGPLSNAPAAIESLKALREGAARKRDVLYKSYSGGIAPQAPQAPAEKAVVLPDDIVDGYQFLGGDPNDPKSWVKVDGQ